ncbi:DUF2987 domain-containing protein [Paraglaciecola aestuariivivens]
MKLVFIALFTLLCSRTAAAEILEVEYATFYSHVKKLDSEETNALRFAFGFKHVNQGRLCNINSVQIVTQKQTLPIELEASQRFTVPVDKILKMAKAHVRIDFADKANQCDMSVQLETLPQYLTRQYTQTQLQFLLAQYQAFFNQMGGFLSFMMPSVEGLVVHMSDSKGLAQSLQLHLDQQGGLQLDKAWIDNNNSLSLPHKPLRITALINK